MSVGLQPTEATVTLRLVVAAASLQELIEPALVAVLPARAFVLHKLRVGEDAKVHQDLVGLVVD